MKSAQKDLKLHLYILDRWQSVACTDIYCTDKSCNFESLPKCTEMPPEFASSEQKLPVHIQILVQNPINPPVESRWWILFTVLGLQKMNFGRSPHVFLLIESLPFPGTLLCVCPPPPLPPPPLHSFYWPTATLNYHGWKEKQIRRAAKQTAHLWQRRRGK